MEREATIINPWKNPHYGSNRDYLVGNPMFVYGDYALYKLAEKDYLHTFKGTAIHELAGPNKELLVQVADRTGEGFLYDQAVELMEKLNLH